MKTNICPNCNTENSLNNKYCANCGHELPKITSETVHVEDDLKKEDSTDNKNKYFGMIVGVIVFALAYYGTQQLFFKQPSMDKILLNISNEMNKSCPIMVDSGTRLDNTITLPNKILQYNYTLINIVKDSIDIDQAKEQLESKIVNSVKSSPQMKTLKDYKTIFNYYYKDKDGLFLFLIDVKPEEYE